MTQDEINKYNAMIAVFVGEPRIIDNKAYSDQPFTVYEIGNNVYQEKHLKFHSDWNELIRVVEKIEEMKYGFEIIGNYTKVIGAGLYSVKSSKLKSVYAAVVQFIQWHNEQEGEK